MVLEDVSPDIWASQKRDPFFERFFLGRFTYPKLQFFGCASTYSLIRSYRFETFADLTLEGGVLVAGRVSTKSKTKGASSNRDRVNELSELYPDRSWTTDLIAEGGLGSPSLSCLSTSHSPPDASYDD